MPLYRERLWPAVWVFVGTALVIPASLLVFLPISALTGVIVAMLLYAACVAALVLTTPVLEVGPGGFRAGSALLPLEAIGEVTVHREDAVDERGPRLDARAWLLIRGWIRPVLKITVADPRDPTPYWLVSTRRPEDLSAAIAKARLALA